MCPHRGQNKKPGILNQLRLFTNEINSWFPKEEYEKDIARIKETTAFCVKAENKSMVSFPPPGPKTVYEPAEATIVIPTGKLPPLSYDS